MENAFFRHKSIIGDGRRVRSPAGQGTEAVLACNLLNQMTAASQCGTTSYLTVESSDAASTYLSSGSFDHHERTAMPNTTDEKELFLQLWEREFATTLTRLSRFRAAFFRDVKSLKTGDF